MVQQADNEKGLTVEIVNGRLQISISTRVLAFAALAEHGGPLDAGSKVTDCLGWAQDTMDAMMTEDEVGNSLLSQFIDDAMEIAANNGSIAVTYEN